MNALLSPAELVIAERIGPERDPWETYVRALLMAEESAREVMAVLVKRDPEQTWQRDALLRARLNAIHKHARRARLLWNAADLIVEELDLKDEGIHEGVKFELRLMDYYQREEQTK